MTRTVEVLDPFTDRQACSICGSLRWVVVSDGNGNVWLLCTKGDCTGRRDLPDDVVAIDPEAE
jgi:hypothetical protein